MLLTEVLTEAKLPAWVLKLPMIRKRVEKFTNIPPMNNRKPLADGQKLDLGGRTIEVISTPGHTPGSICLLDVEQRQLFSGDTICAEVILLMLDHSCSVQTFKESMEHVKSFSKRFDRIWPAHHEAPLDHSWMDEYIQCADQIMSGQANAVEVSSPFGKALDAKFGRIKITYKEDRIFKKDSKKNNPSK